MPNFSTILPNYACIVHEQQNNNRQIRFIAPIRSSNRSMLSTDRKQDHTKQSIQWSIRTGYLRWYNSCGSHLHHIAPHRNIMWCGSIFRHVQAHERCWHCVVSHRINISDWTTIHPIISWGLVYSRTWSHPYQYQPIAPVPHAIPRQSIPCYRNNEYYQSKRIFYSVLGISRGKYIPQHLVSNSNIPSLIPTYWIDFTPNVESTSKRDSTINILKNPSQAPKTPSWLWRCGTN